MSDKVFIPMSIDQNSTVQTGYFTSPMKSFLIIGSLIPGIPLSFYAYSSSGDSYIGMSIAVVFYLIIYVYILRFLVFEELKLKKMLKVLDENKISSSEYFWGISKIDPDGVIHYRYNIGIRKSVVVKVTRGSMVGVSSDFSSRFKECNLNFVRSIISQGFTYQKYTKLEKKQLPEGLEYYSSLLEKMPDDERKSLMRLNIDTVSNFTKSFKSVVTDYYVIYTEDIRIMNSFYGVVRDTLNSSYGNEVYFNGSKILDDDEVSSFIAEVLNLRYINKKGYYNVEDYDYKDFGTVYRVFDSSGREVFYDLEKEFIEISNSKLKFDRRGKTLAELEKELESKKEVEEEVEITYLDEDENIEDIEDLGDGDYEIMYVDEDGNEILDYSEVEEARNTVVRQDERSKYDLEGIDLFSVEDLESLPKKKY